MKPSARATRRALVLLPLALVPSMAMTMLRRAQRLLSRQRVPPPATGGRWRASRMAAPRPAGRRRGQLLEKIGKCLLHAGGILDANAWNFQSQDGKTHRHAMIVVGFDFRPVQLSRRRERRSSRPPARRPWTPHLANSARKAATRSHSCTRRRSKSREFRRRRRQRGPATIGRHDAVAKLAPARNAGGQRQKAGKGRVNLPVRIGEGGDGDAGWAVAAASWPRRNNSRWRRRPRFGIRRRERGKAAMNCRVMAT